MEKTFEQLGLSEPVIKALTEMGFEAPSVVQKEAIPLGLENKDLIVMSKTGSGKTAAFGLPIIEGVKDSQNGPNALILTPTRELAVQVDKEINIMSKYIDIKTTAIYGQHNMNTEVDMLKKGVQVVTGTPGRVIDHIQRHTLKTNNIKYLVLDEADRMLDMGFIDQVIKIIKALPRNRVTMLFSATMPPEIQRICRAYMKEPISLELGTDTKTVDSIKQLYFRSTRDNKKADLEKLIKMQQPDSCMVFCNMRHDVDKVEAFLNRKGYFVEALHGAKNQTKRSKTIDQFKKGKIQILVATDVAARGIHVDDLSLVINYDIPDQKDSYIHRIGRTGRAGNGGLAMSLVTSDDIMSLYEIEEHVGALIEEEELPSEEQIQESMDNSTGKWAGKKREPKKNHVVIPHKNNQRSQTKVSDHKHKHKSDERVKPSHHKKNDGQEHKKNHNKDHYKTLDQHKKFDQPKKTDYNPKVSQVHSQSDSTINKATKPHTPKQHHKPQVAETKKRYETYEVNGQKVKVLVSEKAAKKSIIKRITSIFKK